MIIGIMGIYGSPSCGVNKRLDLLKTFKMAARIEIDSVTVEEMNSTLCQCLIDGKGIYIELLQKELMKNNIKNPFFAHDLGSELLF